jgi:hypothetical protein
MNIQKTIDRLQERLDYEREVGYFESRCDRIEYLIGQLSCVNDDYFGGRVVYAEVVA